MPASLSISLLMLAQAAVPAQPSQTSSSQAAPPPPAAATAPAESAKSCPAPSADGREIIVCTERPQGYRLNPDIMEAKREMRSGGRPVRQGVTVRPDCATIGPVPCVNAGINLIGAALTAVQMVQRLAKGQEVGSMFETDPHPDEYHLYLMAKARREAEEAQKAAAAKAKAAATASPPPTKTSGN
jgi:hypothetical protein